MVVLVPVTESALKQLFYLLFEVFLDPAIVCLTQQMLELSQHVLVFPRVKSCLLLDIKVLDLEEQLQEVIITPNSVKVYCQEGLQSLVTVGERVHGAIMDRVSLKLILLLQYLTVSVYYVPRVL